MIINNANLEALRKTFSAVFQKAFAEAKPAKDKLATTVSSTTRQNVYGWLGSFPNLREWIGERQIHQLKEHGYTITNKSYEATVEVKRDDIEDDALGIYSPLIQELARNAKLHPELLVAALVAAGFTSTCYDGQYFFDDDHPVGDGTVSNTGGGAGTAWYLLDVSRPLKPFIFQERRKPELISQDDPKAHSAAFRRNTHLYGVDYRGSAGYGLWQLAYASKQTLDATNYAAARAAMMSFKNDTGQPLGVVPNLLVVPPTLESAGRALLTKEKDANGADNPWYKTAELLVWPWLA